MNRRSELTQDMMNKESPFSPPSSGNSEGTGTTLAKVRRGQNFFFPPDRKKGGGGKSLNFSLSLSPREQTTRRTTLPNAPAGEEGGGGDREARTAKLSNQPPLPAPSTAVAGVDDKD